MVSTDIEGVIKESLMMHNVCNQFKINSFQKSNALLNFDLLLISCRLVTKLH